MLKLFVSPYRESRKESPLRGPAGPIRDASWGDLAPYNRAYVASRLLPLQHSPLIVPNL